MVIQRNKTKQNKTNINKLPLKILTSGYKSQIQMKDNLVGFISSTGNRDTMNKLKVIWVFRGKKA